MNASSEPAESNPSSDTDEAKNIDIVDILSAGRVLIDLHATSKKRLLEEMAALLVRDAPGVNQETVFRALIDREKLGSTAIGSAVALPHGRVSGIEKPIGAFATLKRPLEYDAPDKEPIQLVFGLLVPATANDTHLRLLSQLAKRFQNDACREALENASASDEAWRILTE